MFSISASVIALEAARRGCRRSKNGSNLKECPDEKATAAQRTEPAAAARRGSASTDDGQAATRPSSSAPDQPKEVTTALPQLFTPTAEAQKLYADFLAEANKRELSGSENFDKSVLTLSSAGLGLSVSFLKDFSPLTGASLPWMLYLSWLLFTVATLSTMASFLVSGEAMSFQKQVAHRAYQLGEWAAFDERNSWGVWIPRLNLTSAAAFFFALIFTVLFIVINLEGKRMANGNGQSTAARPLEHRGAPLPTMQRPASAPAPAPAPPASAPSVATGNGSPSGANK